MNEIAIITKVYLYINKYSMIRFIQDFVTSFRNKFELKWNACNAFRKSLKFINKKVLVKKQKNMI